MPPDCNNTVANPGSPVVAVAAKPQAEGSDDDVRVPGPPARRQKTDQLRVMVAGESGLGKTTFLNNIFRHLNRGQNPMEQAAVVRAQGGGMFGHGSTLRIEERAFVYNVRDSGQEYKFFLVDTPGYGDHVNVSQSFQPVIDYVVQGNKKYLAEISKGIEEPESDGRTDVCLYFIAAHRCKPIDIEYMQQLSKVVAVIPVIGKSDSMTVDEMIEFKATIVGQAADVRALEFFQFSDDSWHKCMTTLRIAGTPDWLGQRQPPPYAVISSQVDDPSGNPDRPDPVRIYPWGTCHVMIPEHSDNTYLQCLLLEVGFQDVKDEMRRRYEQFRREQARPVKVKTIAAMKRLRRKGVRALCDNLRGLFLLVLAMACAVVAAVQISQGWSDRPMDTRASCPVDPPEGMADWTEVIMKIQELKGWDRIMRATDSKEEHLGILLDVLNEHYKNRESRDEAQEPDSAFDVTDLVESGTVEEERAAPVKEEEDFPSPVQEEYPAPVEQEYPVSVQEEVPSPAEEEGGRPAPVQEDERPAPVEEDKSSHPTDSDGSNVVDLCLENLGCWMAITGCGIVVTMIKLMF